MHLRTTSQSVPQDARLMRCCTMMSFSWARTSRTWGRAEATEAAAGAEVAPSRSGQAPQQPQTGTLRMALAWMKCSLHQRVA